MTLIEVVAGLAVLGTLLVSVLLTQAHCKRQSAAAVARLAGCRAADGLLELWWADLKAFPRNGQGRTPAELGALAWRTRIREDPAVERLGGQVVRLEIVPESPALKEKATVVVDVVLPRQTGAGVRLQPD